MPLTLLFLAANPTDTARLRVDQECRAIDAALRGAEFRDRFNLVSHGAVRVEDFPALLMRHRPGILHFSGHGIQANQIALEDSDGNVQPVSLDVLAGWFATIPDNLRCVVLNVCDSEDQARSIAEHVDCVISMSRTISDTGALAFSAAFYQALAYGRDLKTAFDLACLALRTQGLDEQDTPHMITLHADPAQIVLAIQHEKQTMGGNALTIQQIKDIVAEFYVTHTQVISAPHSIFGALNKKYARDLFMLMPFKPELKPIYDDHIVRVAKRIKLSIARADDFFSVNSIMQEIWSAIAQASIIIADCTDKNPNVFYEIGLAHAIEKPVILIAQNSDDVPFDLRYRRYIQYTYTPRGMEEFEKILTLTISEIKEDLEANARRAE